MGKELLTALTTGFLTLGNFYTNITLRTKNREEVILYLEEQERRAFVSPTRNGYVCIYDETCDDQDTRDIERLAVDASARFGCLAMSCLNHDDSVLWLQLVENGAVRSTYNSTEPLSGSAWQIARSFHSIGLFPLIWLTMRWPTFLFEVIRHRMIYSVLGLPPFAVGSGYKYLASGEQPNGASMLDFFKTAH